MTSTGSTAAPRAGADADLGRHPVGRSLAAVIRTYQVTRAGRPSPCRFQPSCSAYGLEAIERHGAARGSWLAVRRLSRCRPLGGKGWDPVPDARTRDRIA